MLRFSTVLLRSTHTVLPFQSAAEALYTLRERNEEFDLVLVEVHVGFRGLASLTGFKLLDHINNEIKIPVITMCAHRDQEILIHSLGCGTSFHITKPITVENLEVLRQNALQRRAKSMINERNNNPWLVDEKDDLVEVYNAVAPRRQINQIGVPRTREVVGKDEFGFDRMLISGRLLWDFELHERFLAAVDKLGHRATPRKILRLMNVEGLTVRQIASHLQKHRIREEKVNKIRKSHEKAARKPFFFKTSSSLAASGSSSFLQNLPADKSGRPLLLPRIPSAIKEMYPTRLWTQVDQRLAQTPQTSSLLKNNQMMQGRNRKNFEDLSAFRQLNHLDDFFSRRRENHSIWDVNNYMGVGSSRIMSSSSIRRSSFCLVTSSSSNNLVHQSDSREKTPDLTEILMHERQLLNGPEESSDSSKEKILFPKQIDETIDLTTLESLLEDDQFTDYNNPSMESTMENNSMVQEPPSGTKNNWAALGPIWTEQDLPSDIAFENTFATLEELLGDTLESSAQGERAADENSVVDEGVNNGGCEAIEEVLETDAANRMMKGSEGGERGGNNGGCEAIEERLETDAASSRMQEGSEGENKEGQHHQAW